MSIMWLLYIDVALGHQIIQLCFIMFLLYIIKLLYIILIVIPSASRYLKSS